MIKQLKLGVSLSVPMLFAMSALGAEKRLLSQLSPDSQAFVCAQAKAQYAQYLVDQKQAREAYTQKRLERTQAAESMILEINKRNSIDIKKIVKSLTQLQLDQNVIARFEKILQADMAALKLKVMSEKSCNKNDEDVINDAFAADTLLDTRLSSACLKATKIDYDTVHPTIEQRAGDKVLPIVLQNAASATGEAYGVTLKVENREVQFTGKGKLIPLHAQKDKFTSAFDLIDDPIERGTLFGSVTTIVSLDGDVAYLHTDVNHSTGEIVQRVVAPYGKNEIVPKRTLKQEEFIQKNSSIEFTMKDCEKVK